MERPTGEMLRSLYMEQRKSPELIAKMYGVHGRTVRDWMEEAGIPRLGPAHLRGGVPATWNIGVKRSEEHRRKNSEAHKGRRPPNYGVGRIKFLCEVCDKEVWDKPYRRKRTCGRECFLKLMHVRGEDHWNYIGPDCSSGQRKRLWAEHREWRSDVLKAANYVCAACPATRELTAHHIHSWQSHPDLRLDTANGICLCKTCHLDFHKETTFFDATPEQLMVWLSARRKISGKSVEEAMFLDMPQDHIAPRTEQSTNSSCGMAMIDMDVAKPAELATTDGTEVILTFEHGHESVLAETIGA